MGQDRYARKDAEALMKRLDDAENVVVALIQTLDDFLPLSDQQQFWQQYQQFVNKRPEID